MSSTDGMLIAKIEKTNLEKINSYCMLSIVIWLTFPLVLMILNYWGINTYTKYGVIATILYFTGAIGWIFGGLFIFKLFLEKKHCNRKVIELFVLLTILILWSVICTLSAAEIRVAIYGYGMLRNCLVTFFFFGGFVLSGFAISHNPNKVKITGILFVVVAIIVSVVSLANKKAAFFGRYLTNGDKSLEYIDSVFNTAGNYGTFLLMAILISIFFVITEQRSILKVSFFAIYMLLSFSFLQFSELIQYIVLFILVVISLLFVKPSGYNSLLVLMGVIVPCTLLYHINDYSLNLVFETYKDVINSRIDSWIQSLILIAHHPVVGLGPQNTMLDANNIFFQVALYLGLTGLVIYLAIIILLVKYMLKFSLDLTDTNILFTLMLVGYVLSTLFTGTFFTLSAVFYVLVGICMGSLNKLDEF